MASGDLWAGAEAQMFWLLDSIKESPRFEISVLLLNDGRLAEKLRKSNIEVTVIPESKYGFRKIIALAADHLRSKKIDIIHSHRYKENVLAAFLKKMGLTKYLVQTVHGSVEKFSGLALAKSRLFSLVNDYYTKKSFDKIVAVSEDIRKKLVRTIQESRTITIHNAIDTKKIEIGRPSDEVRAELGIPKNQVVIGSAGRMVPVKGYDRFIKMAKIIRAKFSNASFVLAGDGPQRAELTALAKNEGIEEQFVFTGHRDDIYDIINCFDLFVISSLHEGIPMVLLEAMALGKPVVSTAVGGVVEVIVDGVSGILTPPDDPEKLAEGCLRLIENHTLRSVLATGGKRRIEAEYSITAMREKITQLYENLYFGIV